MRIVAEDQKSNNQKYTTRKEKMQYQNKVTREPLGNNNKQRRSKKNTAFREGVFSTRGLDSRLAREKDGGRLSIEKFTL